MDGDISHQEFRQEPVPDAGPGSERAPETALEAGAAAAAPLAGLRVAYLVNTYPKVSHTFIRREIRALERLGARVTRIALRGWDDAAIDPEDREEQARTRYVLKDGAGPLVAATARMALARPRRFWEALRAAIAMGRKSVRPLPYHLIYLANACRIAEWLEAEGVPLSTPISAPTAPRWRCSCGSWAGLPTASPPMGRTSPTTPPGSPSTARSPGRGSWWG